MRIEGIRRKSARNLFNAGFSYDSLKDQDHKTLANIVGPFVAGKIRSYFEKIKKDGEVPIYDEEQIYQEVDEIVVEEKQITNTVGKLINNEEYLKNYLKNQTLAKRYDKLKRFCENELSWMHSDPKYFRFFTNHGVPHSNNVLNLINQLLDNWELKNGEKKLNEYEYFLLGVCSWCHDLGMLKNKGEDYNNFEVVEKARKEHAKRIIPYLNENYLRMGLSDEIEKTLVAQVCLYHSSSGNIEDMIETQQILVEDKPVTVRTKLLGALLRLADALDADITRLPREENRDDPQIGEQTKREYRKHEIVQKVAINPKEKCVFIQILLSNTNSTDDEIFTEVTQKFNEEFDSVKNILLKYGININKINFLVVKK